MATKNKHKERSHRCSRNKDQYKQYIHGKVTFPLKNLLSILTQ
nr:MAG TPA: hypothetical protein [Caudoviricetes sp.]